MVEQQALDLPAERNAQIQLTRARTILREMELELARQLSDSFREIIWSYHTIQTTLASLRVANREVRVVQTAYDQGMTTLDQLLQAQRWHSEAEVAYHSSVIDYNLAIMTLRFRKGLLLEYHNINLDAACNKLVASMLR